MITIHTMPNGVRVVSEPIAHARSVSLGIWVKAGSADEGPGEEGIAHFIEHMLFKGTAARTAKQIARQFDLFGGDVNAFTTKESTCFHATVLADKAGQAAAILADMMLHSLFEETDMEKEKAVILDELASVEDSPEDAADELLWQLMFPGHPIGRPIGGTAESVRSFTRQQAIAFMDRHYRPERMVISVAGRFDDALLLELERLFGILPSADGAEDQHERPPALFQAGHANRTKDIEQTHLLIGYPGLPLKDPELYTLAMLDSIAGGTMSSRLFQQIREEKGLAYSVFTYYASHANEGAFVISSAASSDSGPGLQSAVQEVIASIASDGVTEEELSCAKEQMIGSFLIGLESTESRMHRNGNNELLLQTHRSEDAVTALIRQVTAGEVTRLARRLLAVEPAICTFSPSEG